MLACRPHGDLVALDLRDHRMGLHRVLVDGRKGVLALDDEVGTSEHRLELAAVDVVAVADVPVPWRKLAEPVEEPRPQLALVHERGVRRERLVDRAGDREFLVLDADGVDGRGGSCLVLGGDRSHRLAREAHTLERDDRPVLDRVTPVRIEVGEVSTGEDADHPRQRLGLGRVDGQHLCVGERGAQHLSVQHPRHDDVSHELGRAAELLLCVTPSYRPADVRELRALDDRHALTSASSATASTIAW